jgi:hypothetical protein
MTQVPEICDARCINKYSFWGFFNGFWGILKNDMEFFGDVFLMM